MFVCFVQRILKIIDKKHIFSKVYILLKISGSESDYYGPPGLPVVAEGGYAQVKLILECVSNVGDPRKVYSKIIVSHLNYYKS